MKKRKSHAFGKDIYLLGKDKDGTMYWLEAPSWDCGWYWGFGYVETYTNNRNPDKASDISSHTHAEGYLVGVANIYDALLWAERTFSYSEGWQLTELFRQFYLLKGMASFSCRDRPSCHVTKSPVDHGDRKEWAREINEVMLPLVMGKIMEILTPTANGVVAD